MARRLRLPLEISEAIIDHLFYDLETLYACSLVCKSWVFSCRSHIFSIVHIDTVRDLDKFLDVVQSPTNPGRYVRFFSILFDHEGCLYHLAAAKLAILAENLTAVRNLEIKGLKWSWLDAAGQRAILSGFQSVRTLTLFCGYYTTPTKALELVESFPSLRSFSCDGIEFDNDDPPTHMNPPPPLSRLHLFGAAMHPIIKWVLSTECHISDVELSMCPGDEIPICSEFLQRLGPNLERLHLAFFHLRNQDDWIHDIDISQNTSLSSLRLSRYKGINRGNVEPLDFVPWVLSQIRSSKMHTLCLDLFLWDEDLDIVGWSDIERILGQPRFSLLRDLTFTFIKGDIDIQALISQKMPILTQRGIINLKQRINPRGW